MGRNHNTKTVVIVAIRRFIPVTIGRAHVVRIHRRATRLFPGSLTEPSDPAQSSYAILIFMRFSALGRETLPRPHPFAPRMRKQIRIRGTEQNRVQSRFRGQRLGTRGRNHNTKTEVIVAIRRTKPETSGRAHAAGIAAPPTAAQHAPCARSWTLRIAGR